MKNLIILSIAIMLFSSCGRDGAPGAQGPQGPPGADGSSNVFSVVYDVSTWVYDNSVPEYYADLSVPEITNSVINGGTVTVFEGNASSGSTIWYDLSYSFNGLEVSYSISYGNVRIERTMDNFSAPPTPSVHQYKVVVIPPV